MKNLSMRITFPRQIIRSSSGIPRLACAARRVHQAPARHIDDMSRRC
jgi:hypothetical protein